MLAPLIGSEKFVCRKDQRPAQKKKTRRLKKRKAVQVEFSDTEDENDTRDDDEDSQGPTKSPAVKLESDDANHQENNDEEDHVDNKPPPRKKRGKQVGQKPVPDVAQPKAKFKRPPASKASGKSWKWFWGDAEDRTGPKCKRVFTSVLRKEYHCVNRVCEQKKNHRVDATQALFPTLQAGSEFATRWGVVRVIQDGRATPVALGLDQMEKSKVPPGTSSQRTISDNDSPQFSTTQASWKAVRRRNVAPAQTTTAYPQEDE